MTDTKKKSTGFSDAERDAMKARQKELRAEARMNKNREEGEKVLLEAISALTGSENDIATRIHKLVTKTAPELMPKTWYGMPAYANKDGKIVCFYQSSQKFGSRYGSFGFNDEARIDDGNMWATTFAIIKLSEKEEAKIVELVKKAVS